MMATTESCDTLPPEAKATQPTSPSGLRTAWDLSEWKQRWVRRAAVPLRAVCGPRVTNAFGIFMYHRIAPHTPGMATPTCNVTPERFQSQLEGLLKLGYEPWSLRKVLEYHAAGWTIPRQAFVVTFDDGYENNYTRAWPILKELRIPATIFLATAFLGSDEPFPFDDWTAAGSPDVPPDTWRPLTLEQCDELAASRLIEFGTHTHTHQRFRGRPQALEQDLRDSIALLNSRFGLTDVSFAFPFGIHDPALADAAKRSGVVCSLTTASELVLPASDPFQWGRFTASQGDSAASLAVKLDGWYSLARDVWLQAKRRLRGS